MTDSDLDASIDLSGQTAIVTGGGRGIGRAIAQALASAGAAVIVVARTKAQIDETVGLIREGGGCAMVYPADVTEPSAVASMVSAVEARLGPVDLLVNGAGVAGPCGPDWETDADLWWRCMEVNVRGAQLCSRAVLSGMVARGRGRIVHIASGQTERYFSAYVVSKTALIRLGEVLANQTRDFGIGVFSISPGFVRTALTETWTPDRERWLGLTRERIAEAPFVTAEQCVERVLYLASGKADALSGCFIGAQDDLDEMVSRAEEILAKGLYALRIQK